jgi:Sec-independent protein translocase protein TatA
MNVFGVGAWELVAILLIMLVFAGPKRMIHWSYALGQHVAKFRKIWSETVDLVQKEFDDAGVDIKLPKEPPTRKNLNRTLADAVKPMAQPVQDSLDEVKKDMETFEKVSDALNNKKLKPAAGASESAAAAPTVKRPEKPAKPKLKEADLPSESAEPPAMGTWGGEAATTTASTNANGNAVDLGTWSNAAGGD